MIGGEFSGADIHEACPSAVLAVMAAGMPGSPAARHVRPRRRPTARSTRVRRSIGLAAPAAGLDPAARPWAGPSRRAHGRRGEGSGSSDRRGRRRGIGTVRQRCEDIIRLSRYHNHRTNVREHKSPTKRSIGGYRSCSSSNRWLVCILLAFAGIGWVRRPVRCCYRAGRGHDQASMGNHGPRRWDVRLSRSRGCGGHLADRFWRSVSLSEWHDRPQHGYTGRREPVRVQGCDLLTRRVDGPAIQMRR